MEDHHWMRFESTGKVSDYLSYANKVAGLGKVSYSQAGNSAGSYQGARERSGKDGADYGTYRYDTGGSSYWGI